MINRFVFRNKLLISLLILVLCVSMTVPALAYDPATLRNGSSGEEVKAMQQALIDLGYLDGKADGIFGMKTEKAVRSFQRKNGLTADGLAGKKTLSVLESARNGNSGTAAAPAAAAEPAAAAPAVQAQAAAPITVYDPSTLYNGCRGEEVKALQQALINLGYLDGKADGIFGNKTEKAVRRFQYKNGLTSDGLAGKTTLAALGLAQNGGNSSNEPGDVVEVFTSSSEPGASEDKWDTLEKKARQILQAEGHSTSGLNYINRFYSPKSENKSRDYYSLTFYKSRDTDQFSWTHSVSLSPSGKLLRLETRTANFKGMDHKDYNSAEEAETDPDLLKKAKAAAKAFLKRYGYSSLANKVNRTYVCQIFRTKDESEIYYSLSCPNEFIIMVRVAPSTRIECFYN